MENRLTIQAGNGLVLLTRGISSECMQEALCVLADYEDTNLTPAEIEAMKALAQNGQSAIDTNMRLAKVVEALKADNERLRAERDAYKRAKSYWDSFYGQGLEVANWHMNGETEPFDSFWESAEEEYSGTEDAK